MEEYIIKSKRASAIAIDQHARSVTLSGLDLPTGEKKDGRLANCPSAEEVASWASWATAPIGFACESGPCGFQLARGMRALGIDCDVIAVTSIPRSPESVALKDDRGDADALLDAVLSPNSKRKAVYIPSEESEAVRDLVRTYYDYSAATKRWKVQTSGFLLRHGHVWNERTSKGALRKTWTQRYISCAKSIDLPERAGNQILKYHLAATTESIQRMREVESARAAQADARGSESAATPASSTEIPPNGATQTV